MIITGQTTIENWTDNDTINYIKACVILTDLDKKENERYPN